VVPDRDIEQHQSGDEHRHRNAGGHREDAARIANPLDHFTPVPQNRHQDDDRAGSGKQDSGAIPVHHRRGADERRNQQKCAGDGEVAAHVSCA
jgi:hypothetical protein